MQAALNRIITPVPGVASTVYKSHQVSAGSKPKDQTQALSSCLDFNSGSRLEDAASQNQVSAMGNLSDAAHQIVPKTQMFEDRTNFASSAVQLIT